MSHFLDNVKDSLDLPEAHAAATRLMRQVTDRSREPGAGRPGIVGQENLIRRLVSAFFIGENCLLEGLPGLVKTEASKTLAAMLGLRFRRIQFTPDLMPSDLIGRDRLVKGPTGPEIQWEPGPIFTNILLADELNRASSKVQSALLEATEERRVTPMYKKTLTIRPRDSAFDEEQALRDAKGHFGLSPDRLDHLQHFMVLATMNPIELEGVFPLSEAQLDRFAYKVIVDHPLASDLAQISAHAFQQDREDIDHDPQIHLRTLYFLSAVRELLLGRAARERWLKVPNQVREKCELLVSFTHLSRPRRTDDVLGVDGTTLTRKQDELLAQLSAWQRDSTSAGRANWLLQWRTSDEYPDVLSGASPRALLKLIRAAHAEAFLNRHFDADGVRVEWDDVKAVAHDVLRHRIRLTSAAVSVGGSADDLISGLLDWLSES